jgi:hypothetical protein
MSTKHPQSHVHFQPSSEPCHSAKPFFFIFRFLLLLFSLLLTLFLSSILFYGNSLGLDFRPATVHSFAFSYSAPRTCLLPGILLHLLLTWPEVFQNPEHSPLLPADLGQCETFPNQSIPHLLMSGLEYYLHYPLSFDPRILCTKYV